MVLAEVVLMLPMVMALALMLALSMEALEVPIELSHSVGIQGSPFEHSRTIADQCSPVSCVGNLHWIQTEL